MKSENLGFIWDSIPPKTHPDKKTHPDNLTGKKSIPELKNGRNIGRTSYTEFQYSDEIISN